MLTPSAHKHPRFGNLRHRPHPLSIMLYSTADVNLVEWCEPHESINVPDRKLSRVPRLSPLRYRFISNESAPSH